MTEESLSNKFELASDHAVLLYFDSAYKLPGRKGAFVQVNLINVSDEPDIIQQNNFHTIDGGTLSPYQFQGEQILNSLGINPSIMPLDKQIEEIEDNCSGKLLLAYPIYKEGTNQHFKNGDSYSTIEFIQTDDIGSEFFVVPIISTTDLTLLEKGQIIELKNWYCDIFGTPKYLYAGSNLVAAELVVDADSDYSSVSLKPRTTITKYSSRYLMQPKYVIKRDHLDGYCFVRKDVLPLLSVINDTVSEKESEKKTPAKESKSIPSSKEKIIDKNKKEAEPVVQEEDLDESIDELSILNNFYEYTKRRHLCYEKTDILNFQACVNTRMLTILAGMSGTGKTRLPKVYADYFKLKEFTHDNPLDSNNTLLFLPISPSYTEPSDVLGFYDITSLKYFPAETGLVEFLLHAQKHPSKMHLVIFDEMNLSQIEYWFAPFLSVLEKNLGERKLQLFSNSLTDTSSQKIPPSINIGDNVMFIGTINLDETTKVLSDRLLDRSFVINLQKTKFIDASPLLVKEKEDTLDIEFKGNDLKEILPKSDSLMNINYFSELETLMGSKTKKVLQFFDDLDSLLRTNDPQKGVSFRTLRNIVIYLMSWPHGNNEQVDYSIPFDYAVKQTILKKISGSRETIGSLIGAYISEKDNPENSEIIKLFENYSEISTFEKCIDDIKMKAKELRDNDYIR